MIFVTSKVNFVVYVCVYVYIIAIIVPINNSK